MDESHANRSFSAHLRIEGTGSHITIGIALAGSRTEGPPLRVLDMGKASCALSHWGNAVMNDRCKRPYQGEVGTFIMSNSNVKMCGPRIRRYLQP